MNDLFIVTLTKGHVAIVDADDAPLVAGSKWQVTMGNGSNAKHYAKTDGSKKTGPRRTIRMHRLIANPPHNMVVDHINGNTLDNRRANLRVCTQSENLMNKSSPPKDNTSGYVGVWKDKRRNAWIAETRINGRKIHIGQFSDKETAARERDRVVAEYYGPIAYLNFPEHWRGNG